MRVIAGLAGGLKLKTRDSEETKPTLDRVKEAMFSMLNPYLNGAVVLDLFSGSGSLGIEALSRSASECIFCDKSRVCCDIIKDNLRHTGFWENAQVIQMDFTGMLKNLAEQSMRFDIVLLDPPYHKGFERQAMELISKYRLCFPRALCVVEHAAQDIMPEELGAFTLEKEKKYGTVGVSIYEKKV